MFFFKVYLGIQKKDLIKLEDSGVLGPQKSIDKTSDPGKTQI